MEYSAQFYKNCESYPDRSGVLVLKARDDTLVLRKPVGIWIKTDTESLDDDGLALTHEPKQNERQFDLYISEHYDGDIELWRVEASE